MKFTIMGVTLGAVSSFVAGALLAKRFVMPNMKKWCARIESRQIDAEVRLDLMEYNHLHEDGYLMMLFED